MIWRTLAIFGANVAMLATAGCSELNPASYRFRMAVEIETPSGLRSGSGVMEITSYKTTKLMAEERSGGGGLRGQAVVVDLPTGPVFMLPKLPDDLHGPFRTTVTDVLGDKRRIVTIDDYVGLVRELGQSPGRTAELPRKSWPIIVRFGNITDPKSIERVDPDSIGIKRITIETTSDEITTGIEKRLAWLTVIKGGYLHGGFSGREAPLGLDGTDFSTEIR